MNTYSPAEKPTFYFIGVSTTKSSIMRVFPAWAKYLGMDEVIIKGIDLKVHDKPLSYRDVVSFIKNDPLSLGGLITTHKINLLRACQDLFEELDPFAKLTGEISCISKRNDKLIGHAKDPISAGLSLEAFMPRNYWEKTDAEAFILGAGGSSIALTIYLLDPRHRTNRPSRIVVADRCVSRLDEIRDIHRKLDQPLCVEYHHTVKPEESDALMFGLKPGSLVVNATGLGKDAPGSPITHAGKFPEHGFAWEFNYRGDLSFLEQAHAQGKARHLYVEDGWIYFIHGWTRVMAEVFDREIPTVGPIFDRLAEIAAAVR